MSDNNELRDLHSRIRQLEIRLNALGHTFAGVGGLVIASAIVWAVQNSFEWGTHIAPEVIVVTFLFSAAWLLYQIRHPISQRSVS